MRAHGEQHPDAGVLPGPGPPHHRGQVEPTAPGPGERPQAGHDHRDHIDRAVADLRHDRSVELRPRRDGHVRRGHRLGVQPELGVVARSSWRRSPRRWPRPRSAGSSELASVATVASARHGLTSMMIVSIGVALGRPLPLPVPHRRRPQAVRPVHAAARPGQHRADRPRPALAVDHGPLGARSSSASRLFLLLRPLRQGDPRRVRQPRSRLVERHRHRPRHPVVWVLGGALAGLGGVFYGLEFGISWDMGFTLLLLMFAAITLGGLGNPFGALVGSLVIGLMVELWTWVVPERQRPQERRRLGRPHRDPADPPAGHPRQQGADRMNRGI